jgi:hypothetical protein
VELDKIFGHERLVNEIIWAYKSGGASPTSRFSRKHDIILLYSKSNDYFFKGQQEKSYNREFKPYRFKGVKEYQDNIGWYTLVGMKDYWEIDMVGRTSGERIGYPTQKPEALLKRVILASSPDDGIVADFFCGGGTTPSVAQRLGRRWIACDQSRVAVAVTADRISRLVEQMSLDDVSKSFMIQDFTVEHWGIYEAKRLSEMPPGDFRQFLLRAFGAVPDESEPGIHGHKGAIPIWVGEPAMKSQISSQDVVNFANAIRKTIRYQQDNLRDGIILAWAFRPEAIQAAQQLREQESIDLNFIRLDMIRIDSLDFRQHISVLSTDKADYSAFLTFVQPPRVEVGWKRLSSLNYRFDVSETVVLNAGGKIINVQWDFDYDNRFTATEKYSFIRTPKNEPTLLTDYTFPRKGRLHIACKVQDDIGGEGLWSGYIEVS